MRAFLKSILALASFAILMTGGYLMAQSTRVRNVVLVHGAFADGSSWSKVIPLLQAKGTSCYFSRNSSNLLHRRRRSDQTRHCG